MRTFLPPREKFDTNSNDNNGRSVRNQDDRPDTIYLDLCTRAYPEARRVAVLSLIPGLGQFKNGDTGKGWMFLSITVLNILMIGCISASSAITTSLTGLATALHRQPNFELAVPFNGAVQSPAMFIYIGLVIAFVAFAIRDAYDRRVQIIRNGRQKTKPAVSLPEAASGSYLGHFAIMVVLALLVIFFVTPEPPKQQVTEIELVKPVEQPKPPGPPEPKRDRPKPKTETPKPVVVPKPVVKPQVVKPVVAPPKVQPMPIAVATPTNEPSPFTTAPVAAPAAADPTPAPSGTGGAGGTGTGGGDGGSGGEVDMGPWMREMQRKIKRAWFPPKGNESKRIKVSFKVFKDGRVARIRLVSSSGVSIADDAATQAITDAAPFAALPAGVGDEIDINFTFDYNVFGARR